MADLTTLDGCVERNLDVATDAPILPTQPDTCILYQLHLECGRWINLYDWFVSFRAILDRNESATNAANQSDADRQAEIQ
jgi:hypothetical protein